MTKLTPKQIDKIKANTLRLEASDRGGGIEISLNKYGFGKDAKMTAYQNYLGGGMLGSINNDCTITDWKNNEKLKAIANQLAQYFHNITNHEDDEFENASFEENQNRPASAY
jgi:hypothetical protein